MKVATWTGVLATMAWGAVVGADAPVVAWQGRTMGSPYQVKIVDEKLDDEAVASIKQEIEATLREVNRQMSNYQPESELSKFNRAPANEPFKVSPAFARVTRFALELSSASNGAFDPTLGPLINLWGFGEHGRVKQPPSDDQRRATMAQCGWHHLQVNQAGELTKDLPGLALDLGAVAKGHAVDEMIRVLRSHGWNNLYASIAGDIRVLGHSPRRGNWSLGITVPVDHWREDQPMAATVALTDKALSTSGDYQKFYFDDQGRRLCHIIDPRTGVPVQHSLASVTVVAADSMSADGLATTLFVLGADAGMKFVNARPGTAALFIIRQPDGSFRQIPSARFAELTGYRP